MEVCDIEIPAHLGLSEALETLSASSCHALPVVDSVTGRLVGLLTAENAGELMLVKAALRRA
jgi:stage IV sporulation protein FB